MTVLALDQIRLDGGTQPRDHIAEDIAKSYAEDLLDGAVFPPIDVFFDGTTYYLGDGFHRHLAHRLAGRTEIEANVHQGTVRDAILFSCSANAAHGYRRTAADKRRAILRLLNDQEWSQWADREIARHCSVDHKTVAGLRPKPASGEIPRSRKVKRKGKVYQQKVRTAAPAPAPAPAPAADLTPDNVTPIIPAEPPKPPLVKEHVQPAAKIGWALRELAESLTALAPADFARATTYPHSEILGHAALIERWLVALQKEMSREAA